MKSEEKRSTKLKMFLFQASKIGGTIGTGSSSFELEMKILVIYVYDNIYSILDMEYHAALCCWGKTQK